MQWVLKVGQGHLPLSWGQSRSKACQNDWVDWPCFWRKSQALQFLRLCHLSRPKLDFLITPKAWVDWFDTVRHLCDLCDVACMEFLWVVGPLIFTPVVPTGIFVFPFLSLSLPEYKSEHIYLMILVVSWILYLIVHYLALFNFCWHSTEFKMNHAFHRASCPSSCCSSCGSASTSISWSCSSSGGFCAFSVAWASQNSLVAEIGQCLFNLHTPNPPWSRLVWDCSVLLPLPFQLGLPHFGDIPKPSLPAAQKVCGQLHQAGFRPKMCPRHWAPWSCRRSACSAWQSPWPPAEFSWIGLPFVFPAVIFPFSCCNTCCVFLIEICPWCKLGHAYKQLQAPVCLYHRVGLPYPKASSQQLQHWRGQSAEVLQFQEEMQQKRLCKPCMKRKAGHASDDFYRMSQGLIN